MKLNARTISRIAPWLAVVVVGLLVSSVGAQTVQPAALPQLTSDAPKATQRPPTGGTVEDAGTERGRRWGYVFGGVGHLVDERVNVRSDDFVVFRAVDPAKQVGGGIEWELSPSTGVSAEGGLLLVPDVSSTMFSVNGSYRFRPAPPGRQALVPFLTGGVSLIGATLPALSLGVGVDYWLPGRNGLRLELRGTRWRDEREVGLGLGDGRDFLFVDHPWLLAVRIGINFGRSPGSTNRSRPQSSRR